MNKRPERIKIISKRFVVKYVPEGEGEITEEKMGLCDTLNQVIWIEEGLQYDTQKETLIHETFHAVSDEMGANLSEEQVTLMAKGVLAMLMDNPTFARYLMKKEKGTK